MKKLKMISQKGVTFEEGCNLYLNNCKERNLREGPLSSKNIEHRIVIAQNPPAGGFNEFAYFAENIPVTM